MPAFGGLVPSGTPSTSTPQSEVSRGLAPYLENAANAIDRNDPTAPTAPGASGSAVFRTAADSLLAALLNRRQSGGNPYTTYGFGPGGYYTQASINTATGQRLYFVYGPTGLLIGVVDGNGNFVWQNGPGAGDAFGNGIVGAPTPMIGPGTYQGGTGLQNNPNGGMNGTVNPGSGDTSIDDDGTGGLGGLGNRLRFGWAGLQKTKEFLPGSEARRNASGLIKGIPLVGAAYAGYTGATGHDPAAGACESPLERGLDGLNAAGGLLDLSGLAAGEEAEAGANLARKTGCFVAGTPVQMADGTTKPIEQVREGDMVLSRDQNDGADGKVVAARVSRTFVHAHPSDQMVAVTLSSGERIVCTGNHPFFVPGAGWAPAGKLCLGTQVTPRAGPASAMTVMAAVSVVSVVPCAAKPGSTTATVYNFEVEGTHTYFVGTANGGEWVHNDCFLAGKGAAFKEHFLSKSKYVIRNLGYPLRNWSEGGGEDMIEAINDAVQTGKLKYQGIKSFKVGQPGHLYTGNGLQVWQKMDGTFWTIFEEGKGAALNVQDVNQ